jgi:hypothetical protein
MANSANNNAAELIRKQIANLQEVLAILEAKPEVKPAVQPQAKSVQVQPVPKSKPAKSSPTDYKARIEALKGENDYILSTSRIGTPRLVKHVINIIELYYVARTGMVLYTRADNEYGVLAGNSRILINMLKSQELRIKDALKFNRWNGIPERYKETYINERRRAKRLISKNSDVVVKADVSPIEILTDIATTFNGL